MLISDQVKIILLKYFKYVYLVFKILLIYKIKKNYFKMCMKSFDKKYTPVPPSRTVTGNSYSLSFVNHKALNTENLVEISFKFLPNSKKIFIYDK